MTFLLVLFLFLPKILFGFAIAHFLWGDLDLPAIVLKFSIGVPLGFAVSASAFFLAVLIGVSPQLYSWLEFWIILILDIIFFFYFIPSAVRVVRIHAPEWQNVVGALMVLVSASLFTAVFLFYSSKHPYGFEDAWTMWNFTPRFIFRENSAAILSNSQFYGRFHPDYPVELSLNIAWAWFILKEETSRVPMAIAFISSLSLSTVLWGTLRNWKGVVAATIGASLVFLIVDLPSVIGQCADALLVLHILSAAALFYGYLKTGKPGMLVLVGLLAGFSAWVKNEGILFIGVLSAVCVLAAGRQIIQWRALKFWVAGLMSPLFVVLMYKSVAAWQNDLFSGTNPLSAQLLDFSRWSLIAKNFLTHTVYYNGLPISIVIVLIVYMVLIRWDRKETQNQFLLFLVVLGQFTGYFFIYLITPHDLQLHINTSMDRLLSHLLPLALLWIFVALQSPNLRLHIQTKSLAQSGD